MICTLFLLFGLDGNEKNKQYLATKIEEYTKSVKRKEIVPARLHSTSKIEEYAATKFEFKTQIPGDFLL